MIGIIILSGVFLIVVCVGLLYMLRQINVEMETKENNINRILDRYR